MGVSGFVYRYERHFIYWKLMEDGAVGIVTILYEKCTRLSDSGMILGEGIDYDVLKHSSLLKRYMAPNKYEQSTSYLSFLEYF